MKIAIDGREIGHQKAGKGRYIAELVSALCQIDKENLYYIYVFEIPSLKLGDNFTYVKLSKKIPRFIWLGFDMLRRKIDVFFSPTGYHPILFSTKKSILVVHDLAVFLEPNALPAFKTKMIEKTTLPFAIKRANHIISVSENTKNDLIKTFKVNPNKITPIALAPFPKPKTTTPPKLIQTKYKLQKRIVLFVATLEPRKNVISLIKAYNNLPLALKRNTSLVLAGKMGWNTDGIVKEIKSAPKSSHIVETGFIGDEDLSALFSLATVFVYPSWYEGFGLPVLEAMQYGVPVITSNTSSLPEVVGNCAILVDPADIGQITQAIEKIITSPDQQNKYRVKGINRAKEFSWRKTAEETLTVFTKVCRQTL